MSCCPSRAELESLLADRLAGEDEQVVLVHIDSCHLCKAALEELTASCTPDQPRSAEAQEGSTTDEAFWRKVKGQFPGWPSDEPASPRRGTAAESTLITAGPATPPGQATSWSDAPPAPADFPRAGRYELTEEIGRGGMGSVWRGRDVDLGRDLAVKVLRDRYRDSPEVAQRFLGEARLTGRLQHPGVPPVHAVGTLGDGRPFFAMKLVQGRTLAQLLEKRPEPAQDQPRFLAVFQQVCQTLAYAHSQGVIHRDLKPQNIMVGAFGEVQVMDWGLAKVLAEGGSADVEKASRERERPEEGRAPPVAHAPGSPDTGLLTEAGLVLGTPAYMAPEQARAEAGLVDERADVFGLGAMLCEVLTGQPPYVGRGSDVALRRAQEGDLADAQARLEACGADAELLKLARDCLAARPGDRPRNAGVVAERLTAYLTGVAERLQAAELERAAAQARAGAERRARRLALTLAAAVLLGLGGTAWKWWEAAEQRDEARRQERRADANRARAHAAVEDNWKSLAEQERLKEGDLNPLRLKLLTRSAAFYEEFVKQEAGDASLEADRGRAYLGLGQLRGEMGQMARAQRDFQRAIAIFTRLAAEHPRRADYRQELARGHNNLALALAEAGRRTEAEKAYRHAVALNAALARDLPRNPQHRHDLALGHVNVARALEAAGQRDRAEQEYGQALALLGQLTIDFPAESRHRHLLARTHVGLANLLQGAGRLDAAEKEYSRAMDLLKRLVAGTPGDAYFRRDLAGAQTGLGNLLRQHRRWDAAERFLQQGLANRERLAATFPSVPARRFEVASSHTCRGVLFMDRRRLADAEAAFRQARDILLPLAAEFPTVADFRKDLASNHYNLANVLRQTGRGADAEKSYHLALALQEKLTAEFPTTVRHWVELGATCVNLGNAALDKKEPERALAWFDRATAALARDKRSPQARQFLRNAWWGRARALAALSRDAEALPAWDRALALDVAPGQPFLRMERAWALLRTGAHARAGADAQALAGEKNVPGPVIYEAACLHAFASAAASANVPLAEEYAGRAIVLLRKAAATGLFKTRNMMEFVLQDRRLEPLRLRPQFRQLLRELQAGAGE
jgi:tetratricopeptide (TPR) repeat protein